VKRQKRQQASDSNIAAQYGQYDESVSESESDSAESTVEDWELWGDPREVRTLLFRAVANCKKKIQKPQFKAGRKLAKKEPNRTLDALILIQSADFTFCWCKLRGLFL
jgi:hypothetical protein